MNPIKKTVFTLNVDNYAPDICALTYPFMEKYAQKIGAEFVVISERKFPEMPPVYEKLQIKELAKKMGVDWAIFIDSDALIHPDLFDITNHLSKDTVMHHGSDLAGNRWKYDEYLLRDGRNIGSCNWFAVASDWCLDLWTPLDLPFEEAVKNIYPIQIEHNSKVIKASHLIDDYTLSRNIAKFGLKFKEFRTLCKELGQDGANYFWHEYLIPIDQKVEAIKKVIHEWENEKYVNKEENNKT
jgi:hypothetical protein